MIAENTELSIHAVASKTENRKVLEGDYDDLSGTDSSDTDSVPVQVRMRSGVVHKLKAENLAGVKQYMLESCEIPFAHQIYVYKGNNLNNTNNNIHLNTVIHNLKDTVGARWAREVGAEQGPEMVLWFVGKQTTQVDECE